MADHDHGLVQGPLHLEELVLDHLPVDGVHGAERLVHQQHRGVGCQGADHPDPLLLATGEFAGVALQVLLGLELDHVHQLAGALGAALLVPPEQARHDGDVLLDGHVRKQADLLDHVADVTAQADFVQAAGVFAVDEHLPRGGGDQAVDHLQGGALAAA